MQLELQIFGLTKAQCNPADESISVTVSGVTSTSNGEGLVAAVQREERDDGEYTCHVSVRNAAAARVLIPVQADVRVALKVPPTRIEWQMTTSSGFPLPDGKTTRGGALGAFEATTGEQASLATGFLAGSSAEHALVGVSTCSVLLVPSVFNNTGANKHGSGFQASRAVCSVCEVNRSRTGATDASSAWGGTWVLEHSAAGSFVTAVHAKQSLVQALAAALSAVTGLVAVARVLFRQTERAAHVHAQRRQRDKGLSSKANAGGTGSAASNGGAGSDPVARGFINPLHAGASSRDRHHASHSSGAEVGRLGDVEMRQMS